MINVLYFGNKLSKHGRSKSVIETIEPHLSELVNIKTYSNKLNPVTRFAEMLLLLLVRASQTDKVIIDVYSTAYFNIAYALSLVARLLRHPYVLVLHGGNLPERFRKSESRLRIMLTKSSANVAPSPYLAEYFKSKGFRITEIPNPIDLTKFQFIVNAKRTFGLIYVRGFAKVYNPEMAVRAVAELKKVFPHIRLKMIGSDLDGTRKDVEKLISDSHLEENVTILGPKTQDEWIAMARECNVMISTPLIDNAPVSIIEGMALGLPVVSTRVGGVPYILVDKLNGLLVESNDHIAMAEAVKSLLENEQLAFSIQKNGRATAEKYSWSAIKSRWANVLLS